MADYGVSNFPFWVLVFSFGVNRPMIVNRAETIRIGSIEPVAIAPILVGDLVS